jgi:hypothetical protein
MDGPSLTLTPDAVSIMVDEGGSGRKESQSESSVLPNMIVQTYPVVLISGPKRSSDLSEYHHDVLIVDGSGSSVRARVLCDPTVWKDEYYISIVTIRILGYVTSFANGGCSTRPPVLALTAVEVLGSSHPLMLYTPSAPSFLPKQRQVVGGVTSDFLQNVAPRLSSAQLAGFDLQTPCPGNADSTITANTEGTDWETNTMAKLQVVSDFISNHQVMTSLNHTSQGSLASTEGTFSTIPTAATVFCESDLASGSTNSVPHVQRRTRRSRRCDKNRATTSRCLVAINDAQLSKL